MVTSWLALSFFLFGLGLYCLATKRNLIKNVIGICILFAGANLNFIRFSLKGSTVNLLGHSIVITVIALEGCVIAVALAYVYAAHKNLGTLNLGKLKKLRR